ncbi:MAG: hypothetical protein CM1200mP41_36650 [Gammaproteobacteria bacterium]|nr:MAG: hypothetical protein CM1200mP41_36650 [Gammaproteobacteria bacterium]
MSLDICVANTQGYAYFLTQAFENALRRVGNPRHAGGLVTQVEVVSADPAFKTPQSRWGTFILSQKHPIWSRIWLGNERRCWPWLATGGGIT